MPAKRKGNRKRQNLDDETDEISKDRGKDERIQSGLVIKKRKPACDRNEKERSLVNTSSAVSPSCTEQLTGTEIKQDKQIDLLQDETTGGSGPHTLTELDKVKAVVLLEDITFKRTDTTHKKIVEDAAEGKVKIDSVEAEAETVPGSEIPLNSEVNTHSASPLDNDQNSICTVEDDSMHKTDTGTILHPNIPGDKETSVEDGKIIYESENADKMKKDHDEVSQLFDTQSTDLGVQEQRKHITSRAENCKPGKTSTLEDSISEKNLMDERNKSTYKQIMTTYDTNDKLNELPTNNEVKKDILKNQDNVFDSECKETFQPLDSRQQNDICVSKDQESYMHDRNETVMEEKQEVLTDSQLYALDWMSQFPEEEENSQIEHPDQTPIKPTECGDANQQIEDGSTIIKGFIKELSNLNKMILKTKREIENTRRQRKCVTK